MYYLLLLFPERPKATAIIPTPIKRGTPNESKLVLFAGAGATLVKVGRFAGAARFMDVSLFRGSIILVGNVIKGEDGVTLGELTIAVSLGAGLGVLLTDLVAVVKGTDVCFCSSLLLSRLVNAPAWA